MKNHLKTVIFDKIHGSFLVKDKVITMYNYDMVHYIMIMKIHDRL